MSQDELIESDVAVNGITLHVYRTGTAMPPLVFAHGRSDNGLCYWPIAQQFSDEYEIVLYDARDHGLSGSPEGGTSLLDRAQDLAGLIEALELYKPKLVGHSLGAVTVALFAGLYPQIPDCIVLEDPPPFALLTGEDDQDHVPHQERRKSVALIKEKSVAELVEINRLESPTWPEAERQPWAESKLQFKGRSFGDDRIDFDLGESIVSQISCPMLMITADLNMGALYPPQAADELVAELPLSRHVNITGAGHNIRREQPEAFAKAVRTFLDSC